MNRIPFARSIAARILLAVLLLPTLLLSGGLIVYQDLLQDQLTRTAKQRLTEQMLDINRRLDEGLHLLQEKAARIASDPQFLVPLKLNLPYQLAHHLQDARNRNGLEGISLILPEGTPLHSFGTTLTDIMDPDRFAKERLRVINQQYRAFYLPNPVSRHISRLALVPVLSGTRVIAILMISERLTLPPPANALLVAYGLVQEKSHKTDFLHPFLPWITACETGSHANDNSALFIRKFPVADLLHSSHYFVVGADLAKEKKQMHTRFFTAMACGLLGITLSAAWAFAMGRRIATPLIHLSHTALRVAEGRFHQNWLPHNKDEIGLLNAALRSMTSRLEQTIDGMKHARKQAETAQQKLQEYSQNLEKMVEQRTMELRQTVVDLKDTQSQLIHSEKMASIGQLAAGVAHEINNPVGFVKSNLGTIHDYFQDLISLVRAYESMGATMANGEDPAPFLPEISRIREEMDLDFILDDHKAVITESLEGMDRVGRIVSDLKDFSHMNAVELEPADINQCIESTLNIAWNELKYKARIIRDFHPLPEVLCVPQKLNQVFMNLLVNAAQAIEKQGTITIRTRAAQTTVTVAIEDTGSGIPEDVLPKIFDPFFTTKPVGKGTGLGLNISYNIIRKSGGDIRVESTPGSGTTFLVEIPIRQTTDDGEG